MNYLMGDMNIKEGAEQDRGDDGHVGISVGGEQDSIQLYARKQ